MTIDKVLVLIFEKNVNKKQLTNILWSRCLPLGRKTRGEVTYRGRRRGEPELRKVSLFLGFLVSMLFVVDGHLLHFRHLAEKPGHTSGLGGDIELTADLGEA